MRSSARESPPGDRSSTLQIATTEHYTLQMARGVATNESTTRSALFLTVVSAALVAIGLTAQVHDRAETLLFTVLALAVVLYLGVVTYLRVLENGVEDYLYVKEINRIRHLYLELAPELRESFLLSACDDAPGIHHSMGMQPRRWETLLTSAGMVAVLDSVVCGVLAGSAIAFVSGASQWLVLAAGSSTTVVAVLGFSLHADRRWRAADEAHPPLFPSSLSEAPS